MQAGRQDGCVTGTVWRDVWVMWYACVLDEVRVNLEAFCNVRAPALRVRVGVLSMLKSRMASACRMIAISTSGAVRLSGLWVNCRWGKVES